MGQEGGIERKGLTRRGFVGTALAALGLTGWTEGDEQIPLHPELTQSLQAADKLSTQEEREAALRESLRARYQIHYENFIREKHHDYFPQPRAHLIGGIDLTKTELRVLGFTPNPPKVFFAIHNNNELGPDDPAVIPFQMIMDAADTAPSEERQFRSALEKALEPLLVESPA